MSRIRLYGDTTGYIELKAPDVAGNTTVEIPEAALLTEASASATYALQSNLSDVEAIAILGL
jgi:hypothetical protein